MVREENFFKKIKSKNIFAKVYECIKGTELTQRSR